MNSGTYHDFNPWANDGSAKEYQVWSLSFLMANRIRYYVLFSVRPNFIHCSGWKNRNWKEGSAAMIFLMYRSSRYGMLTRKRITFMNLEKYAGTSCPEPQTRAWIHPFSDIRAQPCWTQAFYTYNITHSRKSLTNKDANSKWSPIPFMLGSKVLKRHGKVRNFCDFPRQRLITINVSGFVHTVGQDFILACFNDC